MDDWIKTKIDEIYERYIPEGSEWRHDRRRVLEVTKTQICYVDDPKYVDPPPGYTYVDTIHEPKQVSISVWNAWVKLARREP